MDPTTVIPRFSAAAAAAVAQRSWIAEKSLVAVPLHQALATELTLRLHQGPHTVPRIDARPDHCHAFSHPCPTRCIPCPLPPLVSAWPIRSTLTHPGNPTIPGFMIGPGRLKGEGLTNKSLFGSVSGWFHTPKGLGPLLK